MPTPTFLADTDLLIVGGGPAGCAAAVMAASLGMRSLLVEPDTLCRKLRHIAVVNNVLGGFTTGPELAAAITADVKRADLCHVELGHRATRIDAFDDHVEATLSSGKRTTARYTVVATGVGPLRPLDTNWITSPAELALPPLWEADPAAIIGREVLLLGADRPLGTFLRAHPDTDIRFLVAHPPSDEYKADEVRADPRTELIPVQHLTLNATAQGHITAETVAPDGSTRTCSADMAFVNIGSTPTHPHGMLTADANGYCPPAQQHPRVLIAGDVRGVRNQRIMAAMGSGSEAALAAYYTSQGMPSE